MISWVTVRIGANVTGAIKHFIQQVNDCDLGYLLLAARPSLLPFLITQSAPPSFAIPHPPTRPPTIPTPHP